MVSNPLCLGGLAIGRYRSRGRRFLSHNTEPHRHTRAIVWPINRGSGQSHAPHREYMVPVTSRTRIWNHFWRL